MDQVDKVLWDLKHDPASRRIMTNLYNHHDLSEMALYPCAYSMTFNVSGKTLNGILNQRSQDMLTANGWNVMQYAYGVGGGAVLPAGADLTAGVPHSPGQDILTVLNNTVRAAAQKFGISKSSVHKDLSERLPTFNRTLYLQVKEVLEQNKAERHIRGGIATRKKYKGA